eukprot:5242894-Pleurochrysis_carterae.AAC.2
MPACVHAQRRLNLLERSFLLQVGVGLSARNLSAGVRCVLRRASQSTRSSSLRVVVLISA